MMEQLCETDCFGVCVLGDAESPGLRTDATDIKAVQVIRPSLVVEGTDVMQNAAQHLDIKDTQVIRPSMLDGNTDVMQNAAQHLDIKDTQASKVQGRDEGVELPAHATNSGVSCESPELLVDDREVNPVTSNERKGKSERLFSCEHCGKAFAYLTSLKRHGLLHTGERPYECGYCDRRFRQSGTLKCHVRIHTGERPFECDHCGDRFAQSTHLRNHRLVHNQEKPHRCEFCGKGFAQRHLLMAHSRTRCGPRAADIADPGSPSQCLVCCRLFPTYRSLRLHMKAHSGVQPFCCGICQRTYSSSFSLYRHRVAKHLVPVRRRFVDCPDCPVCGRSFDKMRLPLYLEHVFSHVMNSGPPDSPAVQRPASIKGEKRCERCGKAFASLSSLKRHRLIHTGERPFECQSCGARFSRNDHLSRHSLTH